MLYSCMLLQDSLLWRKSPSSQLSLLSGTSTAENTKLPNSVLNILFSSGLIFIFWKVILQNKGYCFALQYHGIFFSRIVLNKTHLNLISYHWGIDWDHFTHCQVRKRKPSQLQEIGSENTASKRHLHVNLKRKCNQNLSKCNSFFKCSVSYWFHGLLETFLAHCRTDWGSFILNTLKLLPKYLSQQLPTCWFMNNLKRKLWCHFHFSISLCAFFYVSIS